MLISHRKDLKPIDVRPGVTKRAPGHNSSEMQVSEWTLDAGSESEAHVHDFPVVNYVVKGKARIRLGNDSEEVVAPGDYYYVPTGVTHGLVVVEEFTVIVFGPASMSSFQLRH